MPEEIVMLSIRIRKELRNQLKRIAIDKGVTVADLVAEWCQERVGRTVAAKR